VGQKKQKVDLEPKNLSSEEFHYLMSTKGWAHFPSQVSSSLVKDLRKDLVHAIQRCDQIRKKNGVGEVPLGAAHHLVGWEPSFMTLLEELPLLEQVESYLQSPCILNSYGGGFSQPQTESYLLHHHRDTKIFSLGTPSMVNMLLMLDDFTLENGATYILSGSHHVQGKCPSEELFYAAAERFIGKAGDVVLFDGNCWHAAGRNYSSQDRGVLTLTFTTPYMKPQLDYTRLIQKPEELSSQVKRLLGFQAQIPHSLEEWYQPVEKRKFQVSPLKSGS
jgi:hypothetical protein